MVEHCPEEKETVFRSGRKVRVLPQFPNRELAVPPKIKQREVDKVDKL